MKLLLKIIMIRSSLLCFLLTSQRIFRTDSLDVARFGFGLRPKYEACIHTSSALSLAAPKKGSMVDSYQTVSVTCSKCRTRIFRYKKKNGTKSNLIKCYVERICEDSHGLLEEWDNHQNNESHRWECPKCNTPFARTSMIHGRPALKLIGGKTRMLKK